MKNNKIKISTIILISILALTELQAQEAIPTTGGEASGDGGSASYSIGQVFYTTNVGTNENSVAQGVQQPYEISVITEIEEAKDISLSISAYPNPTTDYLVLKVDASTSLSIQSLEYKLYDINGRLLQTVKATGQETQIQTHNLAPASYFVKVIANENEIKVFKIVKQ